MDSHDWEQLYTAAILETNRWKLKSRIDAAQAAIDGRLREMESDHGGTAAEHLEIETAWAGLDVLRKRVEMPQHPLEKGRGPLHYHIRWSGTATLDWQRFGTCEEAEARAKEMKQPGETYTIEEHDRACARCQ